MTLVAIVCAAMVANSAMELARKGWELSPRMLALHSLLVVFGLVTLIATAAAGL